MESPCKYRIEPPGFISFGRIARFVREKEIEREREREKERKNEREK